MFKNLLDIKGFNLKGPNGNIGTCQDALFDDQAWTVRYVDVDTGGWLSERRVLLSPISLGAPSWEKGEIYTELTGDQIESSPKLDSQSPISKEWEDSFFKFHGWPYYGVGMHMWGLTHYPDESELKKIHSASPTSDIHKNTNQTIRSASELREYEVSARDGEVGRIKDFVFDTETWAIRYLVIENHSFLQRKKTIVSPFWVSHIDWMERACVIDLNRAEIECSPQPEGESNDYLDREFEMKLHNHYQRPSYWDQEIRS